MVTLLHFPEKPLVKKVMEDSYLVNFQDNKIFYIKDSGFGLCPFDFPQVEDLTSSDLEVISKLRLFPSVNEPSVISARSNFFDSDVYFVSNPAILEDSQLSSEHLILQKLGIYDYNVFNDGNNKDYFSELENFLFNSNLKDYRVARGRKEIHKMLEKTNSLDLEAFLRQEVRYNI